MSESARSRALPPSSATSHGKIRTENSELLTLLREKTSDSSGPNNHTTSRQSSHHAADLYPAQPPASAGRRLVDVNNPPNFYVSTSSRQVESPAQSNIEPALTNPKTAKHTADNPVSQVDSQLLVPPLNLDTSRDSEVNLSPSAHDSDLGPSNTERNKYLHEILVNPPQDSSEPLRPSESELHDSRTNRVSPVKSLPSEHNTPALSSRSVAFNGDGKINNISHNHNVDESVGNKDSFRNSENQIVSNSAEDFQTDRFEIENTQRSLELDSALHALPTPGQSAPVTGRQTYNVPSPVSTQIPHIDSLSNFSSPDEKEERPVPRTRSSKQASTLSSRSIPIPGQGTDSPRQSATTRLSSSRDQSATVRGSSGVYAVANPAVLIAQGITPTPSQQNVQFTPRPQPRSRPESFVDSLELSNKETGEIITRDQIEERKKSAVSFEDRDKVGSLPLKDPYTEAGSPELGVDPDWDTPRVKDRTPTPHPVSDTHRHSPAQPVWEKEEQESQRSPEPIDISKPAPSVRETEDNLSTRSDSPDVPLSPTPLDEDDRKVGSALLLAGGSAKSVKRVSRTDSLPTVQKVYVESPTFTREEEDEYRFVESRLGEIQDDVEDTLRKLDEETEKQRKFRKQLEDQMATMYAPAYEDQRNGQSYSRNPQYSEPPRENMGSYSNVRHQEDNRSYQEPRRENMGSYSTLRNEERNNIRNDDRGSYNEQRKDNMGSYSSLRHDDRQSYGEPRRENLGSYTSLRNDERNSYGEPRRDNMGSYSNVRNEDRNSYNDVRRDNMGSYTSLRNDDRNSYGEPRRDNMGSYTSVRNDDRQSYAEQRRENMGSYASVRTDERRPHGDQPRENMGSYANVNQEIERNSYADQRDNPGYNPRDRPPDSYGRQNEAPNNQEYGNRGHDEDRYEDRDYERNGVQVNRNRYESQEPQDQQPESEQYNPQSHTQNLTYEPHDDDLKREAEYQEGLKMRISESGKKDMEIQIPRLPLQSEQFRDSLEEDNFRDWDNPPPNPFGNNGGPPHQQQQQQQQQRHQQYEEPKVPGFVDENDTARMEFLHPKSPRYDFIEMNKIDYGKPHEKSYREIKHVREEESRKLDKIFIHPKPPNKTKKHPVKPGLKSAPSKFQMSSPIEELDPEDPAQALWAKRSAQLKKKDSKTSSGNSNKHKGLQRNQSDSRLVRPMGQGGTFTQQAPSQVVYGSPTRNHFLEPIENRPPPPPVARAEPQYTSNSEPINFPERFSDHQSPTLRSRPLDLKPITQEIITEDGQRISVDINLKVLSPPPGSGSGAPPIVHAEVHPKDHNRRPTGMQYQMEETYPAPEQDPQPQQNYTQYYDAYPRYNYYYPDDTRYDQENVAPPHGGDYQQQQYQDETYRMSPYPKIPPINLTEEELDRQLAELEQNGYAAMYKQNKNKPREDRPWYQVYTINDYRKMQNEVRLSRAPLGPDLDNETYKEKLEKRHKQFEYARMVMEKNRHELDVKKPPSNAKKDEEKPNKRKTAIEYSKNIPKPNVKARPNQYNSYEVAAQLSPAAKKSGPPSPTQTVDVIDLQKLKQRHDQEKQNVASIRQNMESVPQKA